MARRSLFWTTTIPKGEVAGGQEGVVIAGLRVVFHRDINDEALRTAIEAFKEVLGS